MLRILPEYKNADIIRTRDPQVIATGTIVVDVGSVYDPQTLRFDHHQREFKLTFSPNHEIRLSSAGLVYKHFGKQVLSELLGWPMTHEHLELIYQRVYNEFILAFDGIDNGVTAYPLDIKPKYLDSTGISSRVRDLNPWWNAPPESVDLYQQFLKAIELTGSEFASKVRYLAHSWLPARSIVESDLKSRFESHASGKIMILNSFCPWKEHLFDLENESTSNDKLLYVIYEDDREKAWRIQAVPMDPNSFESRKALPAPWRGLRDNVLAELTLVPDSIFVHATGFIGGCKTKQGALKMAIKALEFK